MATSYNYLTDNNYLTLNLKYNITSDSSNLTEQYDHSWREDYKKYTSSKYELDLLENGPHSLMSAILLGALRTKWEKIRGLYKPHNPPDCQSSFNEFNARVIRDHEAS